MSDDNRATVLHERDLGRPAFAKLAMEARKRKALRLLKTLSKQHLAGGRKQPAVFAYDLIGHRINLDGVYEGENLDLLFDWLGASHKDFLASGCAIDIGANIGNHSLYFSDHFRMVHSFEPNPKTFALLQLNAGLADNIVCHNAGISDVERDALLDTRGHNTGVSKVSETTTQTTVPVRLRKLDSLLDATENVRLIKIDVEGHETQVLLGSEATIRKHRPLVIFEQHRKDFANGTTRAIDILKGYGYSDFAVVQEFPPRLLSVPKPVRRLCRTLLRLLFGERRQIRIKHSFEPGFYAFIIALPDWALA